MEEMDWDTILVSSHLGARVTGGKDFTDHSWWQGKFYSRTGKDTRFQPFSVCGEGKVQGIHGANCRHSHGPGDGEFNPYEQYDSEENRKAYEIQQRQSTMERRIRDSKRKCMGLKEAADKAGTPEGKALAEAEYQKQAALLQKRNAAYNQFCEDNDLKKRNERITIAKWDRKQASQARAAARKAEKEYELRKDNPYTQERFYKTLEKAKNRGIIKVKNNALENGLPIKGDPNTIVDKIDDEGNTLQRRLYGADGMASVDFDTSDHGLPKAHPTGAHKHIFYYSKKKPRGNPCKLTEQELKENEDIIQKGVNYRDKE